MSANLEGLRLIPKKGWLFSWPLPHGSGASLVSTREQSPLAALFLYLWERRCLPAFQRVLVDHRSEPDWNRVGHCESYARAFRADAAAQGIEVQVLTADVGLADDHWWVEHGGEALDVVTFCKKDGARGAGPCPRVDAADEFRELRGVVGLVVKIDGETERARAQSRPIPSRVSPS